MRSGTLPADAPVAAGAGRDVTAPARRALVLVLILVLASLACFAVAQDGASGDASLAGPILVLGDSIVAWNAANGGSVGDVIAAKLGARTVSVAVPGSRVLAGPDPIPGQYVTGPWSWVVVQGGGNDLVEGCGCGPCSEHLDRLLGPDGTSGALADLVTRIRSDGPSVALWSYYEMPSDAPFPFNRCNDELAEVHARLGRLAEGDERIVLVDGRRAVRPSRPWLYDRDRVHPSPAGSRAIGTRLAEVIASEEGLRAR